MLPPALIELLKEIFKGLLILVVITGAISALIALLQGFVNGQETVKKVIGIVGTVLTGLSIAFVIYLVVTTVGPYLKPWDNFDRLSDPAIYQKSIKNGGATDVIKKGAKKGAMLIPTLKTGLIGFGKLIGIEVI